jgi:PAS domain S-box-containing protein
MPAENPTNEPERRGQAARTGPTKKIEESSPEQEERAAAIRRGLERERLSGEWRRRAGADVVVGAQIGVAGRAFTALADNVRDYAIFLMDRDGTILYWGEGARLIKWWTKEQAEGGHLRMLYPAGGSEDGTAEEHLRFAAERGEYTGEGQRIRSDGSTFWAGVTLTALWDDEGTLLGFAKVTRDLTARRAADSLLQSAAIAAETARADAVAASAAKSGFLATISHEIRTPLNAILGYHELLDLEIDGPLTEGQRRHLERARAGGRHLLGLITEVLDFSRIDAERAPMKRSTLKVGDAVRGALELTAPQAHAGRLTISDAVSGYAAGLAAWGDEQRVRQILTNLLANAVKFTQSRDEEPGRITVSAGAATQPPADAQLSGEGPWVYIRVEDTGRGIAPSQLRAVFEPFVQADMTLTREHGGTGLGLAISRRLARLMNGDLTVRSEIGVGSTFFLWLPAAPAESMRVGGVEGHGPGSSSDQREEEPPRREGAMNDSALLALGDVLLSELERVLNTFVSRLRRDPGTPSAHAIAEPVLEDHLASFVADVAATLSSIDLGSNEPSEGARDGSVIQRVVAQRHGAQRARLGWAESEVHREFEILGEELASAVRRRMPLSASVPTSESGRGEAERALEYLQQALRIAEGLSVECYRSSVVSLDSGRRAD